MLLALYRTLSPLLVAGFSGLLGALDFILKVQESVSRKRSSADQKLRPLSTGGIHKLIALRRDRIIPAHDLVKQAFTTGTLSRSQPVIWIHAASGEFEYAKPVLRDLARDHQVVVSYFSPSYKKQIAETPEVRMSFALPFDSLFQMRSLIQELQPQHVLVARSDLWPNMIFALNEFKIPVTLFSASFRPTRSKFIWTALFRLLNFHFYSPLYNALSEIFVVSESDQIELQRQFQAESKVLGDTRYDQVLDRLKHPKADLSWLRPHLREFVFIAGSTWPEDEPAIFAASSSLYREQKHSLILVPHEPSPQTISRLEREIQARFPSLIRVVKLSEVENSKSVEVVDSKSRSQIDVLIVDRVGILADLYRLAHFAFVGGSFRSKVHSVMEPLASGCFVFVGPKHTNNREAVEFQSILLPDSKLSVVQAASTAEDLTQKLRETAAVTLGSEPRRTRPREQIQAFVAARSGKSALLSQYVRNLRA